MQIRISHETEGLSSMLIAENPNDVWPCFGACHLLFTPRLFSGSPNPTPAHAHTVSSQVHLTANRNKGIESDTNAPFSGNTTNRCC